MRRALVLISCLLAPTLAAAQGASTERPVRKPGEPIGRVSRVRGKALIELPGKEWNPLKVDRPLSNGARVKVSKGSVEVVLGKDAAEAKERRAYAGHRVVLKSGGRIGVGPVGTKDDLTLEEGEAFAFSLGGLRIRIGRALLELGAADAELKARKGGAGQVVIHQGRGVLETPSGKLALAAGDRVRLTAKGVPTRSQPRLRLPKYVVAHESTQGVTKLLWRADFRRWIKTPRFGLTVDPSGKPPWEDHWLAPPRSARDAREGIVRGLPGQLNTDLDDAALKKLAARGTGPMEVRLGRGLAGLFKLEPGARVRITYRISQGPLYLRPTVKKIPNTEDGLMVKDLQVPCRANLWTIAEVKVSKLIEGPDPVLTFLSIDAGLEGKASTLEVKEIVAYVP